MKKSITIDIQKRYIGKNRKNKYWEGYLGYNGILQLVIFDLYSIAIRHFYETNYFHVASEGMSLLGLEEIRQIVDCEMENCRNYIGYDAFENMSEEERKDIRQKVDSGKMRSYSLDYYKDKLKQIEMETEVLVFEDCRNKNSRFWECALSETAKIDLDYFDCITSYTMEKYKYLEELYQNRPKDMKGMHCIKEAYTSWMELQRNKLIINLTKNGSVTCDAFGGF